MGEIIDQRARESAKIIELSRKPVYAGGIGTGGISRDRTVILCIILGNTGYKHSPSTAWTELCWIGAVA